MKTGFTTIRQLQTLGMVALVYLVAAAFPYWDAPGLNTPEPMGAYLNGVFPDKTPSGGTGGEATYAIENAFPNLTFVDPVDMIELPNRSEFLVVGLQGQIWKIGNDPSITQKQLLLDISANTVVYRDGGMLGITLHPEYGQAGSPNSEYIYVFYRYTPVDGTDNTGSAVNGYMRLSRFNLAPGSNTIDPNSEYVMIQVFDRHDWHNGGDMFFGPDGFLYLVVGDEGAARDSYGVTQQIDKWLFGGVLRIDVDQRGGDISHPIRRQPLNAGTPPSGWPDSFTQGYYIPYDNPWQDVNGGILEEFFAIGTRSPHRMTYDPPTGEIWIGDIGQGAKEEISIVAKGDNLQWPYREGDQNGFTSMPNPLIGNDKDPIYAYGRNVGRCVIGGFVYRGNRYPELKDKYFFGDHETQNVWTLTKDPNGGAPQVDFLLKVPVNGTGGKDGISSFYIDSKEYIYILDLFGTGRDGGVIHKLKRTGGGIADPPAKLSDLGVFTNMQTLETISGIIPYEVNTPLWSDRANKRRWIALPNDGSHDTPEEQITFDAEGNWQFPAGTVMIKHFDLPTNENDLSQTLKLETRFVVFTSEGDAYGLTYRWNEEGTEAFLIGVNAEESRDIAVTLANGNTFTQTWDFPSRQQCLQCHNSTADYALGVKTRQLNGRMTYPSTGETANQLETWNHLGMFNTDIASPDQLPALASLSDATTSEEMRVRSYLDANCSFCHRPNGVQGVFDARSLNALHDQQMIGAEVISNASPPGFSVVKPGDYQNSVLWMRDSSTGSDRMPPVGRNLNDDQYLNVLTSWISSLDLNGPETIAEGWYTLEVRHSGQLATVNGASTLDGTGICQSAAQNADHQQWYIQPEGNHKYRITAKHSDMVLSVQNLSPSQGVNVIQEPWTGSQEQLWYFEDTDSGYYRIRNAYNSLDLDVFEATQNDGEKLIVWKAHGRQNQQWRPIPVPTTSIEAIGETGTVSADHIWKTVSLSRTYQNPVVVAGAPTYNGGNQTTVRIQNVSANSFEIRIDEWECLDEWHVFETIPYMVVEAGTHTLTNGKLLQAGNIAAVNNSWTTQAFPNPFSEEPIVLAQCTSENEAEAVNVRIDQNNTRTTQLRLRLKERDKASGGHANETLSWIALEPGISTETMKFEAGNTGRSVKHNWYDLGFSQNYGSNRIFLAEIGSNFGGDACALRYRNLSGTQAQVFVEEEKCGDSELNHTTEEVHYLVFEEAGDILAVTTTTQASVSNSIVSPASLAEESQFEILYPAAVLAYPNPLRQTDKFLTLDIRSEQSGAIECQVFNAYGRLVHYQTDKIEEKQTFMQVDLSSAASGTYFVQIKGPNWLKTHRIVVE